MAYDEFFTNDDKPYAENLNDSLLLLDAFDVTVPVELPTMFNNGQFSSTTNVARKCGVGIVTLKSASSGITVGTNSIRGSGTVVLRVYPNFNSFYKWKSIVLTKTGTVNVSFAKTDGTSISATVANDGTISETAALKTLQEIDVTLTLTSATITKVLINFVNNQTTRTRTGALLNADQLTNVNGSIANGNTKAVNGGTVYTALNSKENSSNKVTTLDNSTSHYPSCSAVKAVTDGKANSSHTHNTSDITGLINLIYPIGSIYMSTHDTDPGTLFGVGAWTKIEDRFLLAAGSNYTAGATDGAATVTLTAAQSGLKAHSHGMAHTHRHRHQLEQHFAQSGTGTSDVYEITHNRKTTTFYTEYDQTSSSKSTTDNNTASNATSAHNNMPPYLVVNVWKRTA